MTRSGRRYRLAANAEVLFTDLAFIDRVRLLRDLGYAVEFWSWQGRDLAAIARVGADLRGFTGHLAGSLVDPEEAVEFMRGAVVCLEAATELGCANLVLHMTEIAEGGRIVTPRWDVSGAMWLCAYRVISELADLAERHAVTYLLENLNTAVDHPGAPLSRARDIIDLVAAVGSPRIRVLLDLYHAQIGEGNLIELVRAARPWLGEVQVADVPGRHEPGTGEINFAAIAAELRALDFEGVVGLEAWPAGDPYVALTRFSTAF